MKYKLNMAETRKANLEMLKEIVKALCLVLAVMAFILVTIVALLGIGYVIQGGLSAVKAPASCLLPKPVPAVLVQPEHSIATLPVGKACVFLRDQIEDFSCADSLGHIWLKDDYACKGPLNDADWLRLKSVDTMLVVVSHNAQGYHISSTGHLQWQQDTCYSAFRIPVASLSCGG